VQAIFGNLKNTKLKYKTISFDNNRYILSKKFPNVKKILSKRFLNYPIFKYFGIKPDDLKHGEC
jgi:hypothetical protein